MTTPADTQPANSDALDIVTTRVFAAPRELVFDAFRNPDQLIHWWGPNGFTNSFHQFDFRPGGAWRFTMHGPDGANYEIEKRFTEIIPPERVTLEHVQAGHNFQLTMTFADTAGGTTLTWRMRFESADENEKLRGFICAANEENFDRLQAYLALLSANSGGSSLEGRMEQR